MNDEIESLSDIFKALADPTRLRLLVLLSDQSIIDCEGGCTDQKYLCVGALAQKLSVTQSAVSQHLRVLRHVRLIKGERRGAFMHYSLNNEGVEKYRDLVEQIMGVKFVSG